VQGCHNGTERRAASDRPAPGEIVYRSPPDHGGLSATIPRRPRKLSAMAGSTQADAGNFDGLTGILWFRGTASRDVIKNGGGEETSHRSRSSSRSGAAHPERARSRRNRAAAPALGRSDHRRHRHQNGGSILTRTMLLSAVRGAAKPIQMPRRPVIHVSELPKTATGKIEKKKKSEA